MRVRFLLEAPKFKNMIVAHAEENIRLLVYYINSRHINREDIITIVPEKEHFCVVYNKN